MEREMDYNFGHLRSSFAIGGNAAPEHEDLTSRRLRGADIAAATNP